MQLYNITENLKQFKSMVDDGVDPDQLKDALEQLEDAFEDKAKSVLFVIQNMMANIEQIKAEETRLKDKRAVIDRQLTGIKEYLLFNMSQLGISKVDNGITKASATKPKPMLVVSDDKFIPAEYKTEKLTISVDKRKLLSDLKDGVKVTGASIGESKAGLTIK